MKIFSEILIIFSLILGSWESKVCYTPTEEPEQETDKTYETNSIKSLDNIPFFRGVFIDIEGTSNSLYIYSKEMILAAINSYLKMLGKDPVCYSVKANSNLAILKVMAEKGMGLMSFPVENCLKRRSELIHKKLFILLVKQT